MRVSVVNRVLGNAAKLIRFQGQDELFIGRIGVKSAILLLSGIPSYRQSVLETLPAMNLLSFFVVLVQEVLDVVLTPELGRIHWGLLVLAIFLEIMSANDLCATQLS